MQTPTKPRTMILARHATAAFAAIALVLLLGVGSAAQAEILFSDTFNRPNNNDVDASTVGMGGTLGSLSYVERESAQIYGGKLRLGQPESPWVVPDHDFIDSAITDAGGFIIEFDLNPLVGSNGSTNRWGQVSFGWNRADATSGTFHVERSTKPFGMIIKENGTFDTYLNSNNMLATGTFDTTPTGEIYHVELTVATSSFAIGQSATVWVDIDGTPVSIGGSGVYSHTFNWLTGHNYINLEHRGWTDGPGEFDNLRISTIPEPSTLVLLATALLAGILVWRRRK